MSKDIQIRIDPSDVEKKIKKLENVRNGGPKAVMRAMNRTVTGMKTDAGKETKAQYTVNQKDVKGELHTEKASMSDLSITMRSQGRPMASVKFHSTPNKSPGKKGAKPVSLKVKAGGSVKRLSGGNGVGSAFMATMKSGHTGIFERTGKLTDMETVAHSIVHKNVSRRWKRTFSKEGREEIREVTSPGVVQMLNNPTVRENIQNNAEERFTKELDHQVDYLLNQQKG